jgi:nitrogen regulatory protein PII
MVKLEVAVQASFVDKLVDTIARSARTGERSDGEITVTDIDRTTQICTGMTAV